MLLHGKALTYVFGRPDTQRTHVSEQPLCCELSIRWIHTNAMQYLTAISHVMHKIWQHYLCCHAQSIAALSLMWKGQEVELAYRLAAVYCMAHPRSTTRPCLSDGRVARSMCAASAAKAGVGATSTGRAGPVKEPRCTSRYSRPVGTSPGSATCSRSDLSY